LDKSNASMLGLRATVLSEGWNHAGTTPAPAFTGVAVCRTVLLLALSLLLAGCGHTQSDTPRKTNLHSPADTRTAHNQSTNPSQPEVHSTPAQPIALSSQSVSETKPLPATNIRGAEKLAAASSKSAEKVVFTNSRGPEKVISASAPAALRPGEKPSPAAKPLEPKAPATQDSNTPAASPVTELIFKGPPRPEPKPRSITKALGWLGVGLGGVALAILGRLLITSHAKPREIPVSGREELPMARELLFKEPVTEPNEPVATGRR
jgi:hypothetical protein